MRLAPRRRASAPDRGSRQDARPDGHDGGAATIEFVVLGVLLMVPLAYALVSAFAVQSAAYGVSAAAREAGRAFVQTPGGGDPYLRAQQAAWVSLQDHGIELPPDALVITCSADPCLTPGAAVLVSIDLDVTLPYVPDLFGAVSPVIGVDGRHTAVVDRFRG